MHQKGRVRNMTQNIFMSAQLEREIGFFETNASEHGESWKASHDEAMTCRDLEDLLGWGLDIWGRLNRHHKEWHDLIAAGKVEYSQEREQNFKQKIQELVRTCERLISAIEKFQAVTELRVDYLDAFREVVRTSPYARPKMSRERFSKLVKKYPVNPDRYDVEERSLSKFN
jgi:hypothetical protein